MRKALSHTLTQLYRQGPAGRVHHAILRKRRQGPYRGYVDGLSSDGVIRGWVFDRRTGQGRVPVALFAGDTLVEASYANTLREDVRGATGGEVECGFQFAMTETLRQHILDARGWLTVWTNGPDRHWIGDVHIPVETGDALHLQTGIERSRHALEPHLDALLKAIDTVPLPAEPDAPLPPLIRAPLVPHQKLFSTEPVMPDVPDTTHPAYLDFSRYRFRLDANFDPAEGPETDERFLYWFLTGYRAQQKLRTPFSAALLEHLNTPLVMGGQTHVLSRAMWWRLVERPDLMGRLNLNDPDAYHDILFWWAHQDAPALYMEDCLVPDRFADSLRSVHSSRQADPWPLTMFTERYFLGSPHLHFLSPGTAEGRKALLLHLLIHAASRPDLLRYMPRSETERLLAPAPDGGPSDLEAFVTALAARDTPIALPRARYAAILRGKLFDLDSNRFLTCDAQGNRFEAAALPRPVQGETVDVQLIGPLAKASGLGQATRLSADILRTTGLSMRAVDFDLDNPAPEGFSSDAEIQDYGPARINLIHLNAESIPLAFAFQPDVFSERYNIGYFFWELDRPAYCHYLSLELLDEIWVSTDYGVEIYSADAQGKPVVNVGMCYEDIPDIDRSAARSFVEGRFGLNSTHFICLVAFDSFSFVQRKNPIGVLHAFKAAFEGVPNARLIVKTQNRDSVLDPVQVKIWDEVDALIASDPRIVVMNETLSYRDLLQLKAGSDCYISLHKSEGWGFGMIEAMNLGVPVVCTAYSGNMDFCSDETVWLVNYEMRRLEQGDYIFVREGSQWAEPDIPHAAAQMRACYDNAEARAAKARAAQSFIRTAFSREAIADRYGARLRAILQERPG